MNKKISYGFLFGLAMLFTIALANTLDIKIFQPPKDDKEKSVKIAQQTIQNSITSETKPEVVIQKFLTLVHDNELNTAYTLLTQATGSELEKIGATGLAKFLGIDATNYTSISISSAEFTNGAMIIKTQLNYADKILKKTFKLIIQDAVWKIQSVDGTQQISPPPTETLRTWNRFKDEHAGISYPKDWLATQNGKNSFTLQNFDDNVTDYDKIPLNSAKIDIKAQEQGSSSSTLDDALNCTSFPNAECGVVEINGTEYKRIVANAGSVKKPIIILATVKNGYIYAVTATLSYTDDDSIYKQVSSILSTLIIF